MNFEVSFRNLRPRDEIRRRAHALFRKLQRFLDPAAEGSLVLGVEHDKAVLEIVVTTRGTTFKVAEEDDELRAALDKLFHTLEGQLRRAKERRLDRRREEEAADEPTLDEDDTVAGDDLDE